MTDNVNLTALPEEEEDYTPDLLSLEDEDGKEHNFEVLDAFEMDDERYLAMAPYSEDAAERLAQNAEILMMRLGEEDGEEYLDLVEDEEEFSAAMQVFFNRMSDVYDIDVDELRRQLEDERGR
ncbi:DUF1292 domain-containing protein [Ruminococcaceae bacterium OttesenSCG-928-O06]|nr:DUF1292 domain-containing protein [Ruminococcaceae bacterium OttesenSCG-928-O06]